MKINTNGIETHYTIEGDGPWLTMSHSLACNSSMWDEQAKLLSRRFKVLRYDTRGHGGTEATEGAYDFDLLTADVVALWDALGVACSHYVGLSLGGTTGLELAVRYPERVASLAACDCRCNAPPEFAAAWEPRIATAQRDGTEALVEPTLQRWFTPEFRAKNSPVLEKVARMIRATSAAGYVGCAEALKRIDVERRLGEVRCPTLFLTGDKDPSAPPDLVRKWQGLVPDSRFAAIAGAAHITNIEQPEAFNAALDRFLGAVARPD